MKITCQACGAKYTIADDKVRGRKVKIRCKGCSAPIVVDAQQGGAEVAADATAPDVGAAIEAAGPSAPPPAEAWSVNLSDTDQRTMSSDEIVAGYKSGLVTADAFVWKEGMADWVALFDCAELAPLLGSAPAAAAPAPVVPAPAPAVAESPFAAPAAAAAASPKPAAVGAKRAGGRDAGAVDLFGGVQHAGSEEEEIATSAPQMQHGALPTAGSTAYGDDKMTGQRNENSVLFSLDSLKAGVNEAPKPMAASPKKGVAPPRKGPGSATQQQSSDPFGMGGGNDLMNIGGGGNPLFNMNANQALLTAPAPPEPPPPARSTDLGLSGPLSTSSVSPKKGKGVIIGAAIAVVGLIVIGVVAMSGGSSDKADNTTPSATAETAAAATTESPKVEEKKEEPKAEEKKEEPKAEPSAAPAASAAPTEAPKSTTPAAGPGPGPGPKPKEKEEPAPAAAAAPFSISAAQAALGSAAGGAGSCKKPGGPTGSGKVQVTFAPSGRVTSANVAGPPFAGTAVGGCVAGVFRRAKVPPFSGNPVTVSKSFSVN